MDEVCHKSIISVVWFKRMIDLLREIPGMASKVLLISFHASFLGQNMYGVMGTVPWLGTSWSSPTPMFFSGHGKGRAGKVS